MQETITKEKEFIERAVQILNENKSKYDDIKEKCIDFLGEILFSEFSGITISGRIKDAGKLPEKIYRKNYFCKYNSAEKFISDLPDGIGIRIVCLMKNEEEKIYSILKNKLTDKKEIGKDIFYGREGQKIYINFSDQPEKQKNNLDIYRMDAIYLEGEKNTRIEIQIKCLTHYFWGELEHSLFYKNYDFTISNNFYASLMKNINSELENLDYEIELLQKHMAKTPDNQVNELRQIASLMISKKYENQIKTILNCKIDLREVYAVLVDMHFGLIKNAEEALRLLNVLINKLSKSQNITERFCTLIDLKINEQEIGPQYLDLVKILDKNIHSGDIFWKFLFLLYEDIHAEQSDDYSSILQEMAKKIQLLYSDVMDAADALQGSDLNLQASVNRVFNQVMTNSNKIGYYALDFGLNKIKEVLRKNICCIQKQIILVDSDISDIEVFNQNCSIIESALYISVMVALEKKIEKDCWTRILQDVKDKNDYQIYLFNETLDSIKKSEQLEKEDFIALDSVFRKEEEDV